MSRSIQIQRVHGCRLWIDGVGNWLVWFRDALTFGNGVRLSGEDWRMKIMADLNTQHARWMRRGDEGVLLPTGPTRLNGTEINSETRLKSRDRIQFGQDVEIRYEIPSPLSLSAVLHIESGHRMADHSDGIVLMNGTCLLGPGDQSHIPCRHWQQTMVLYEWDGVLCWKLHQPEHNAHVVLDGELIGDAEQRLRIESLTPLACG